LDRPWGRRRMWAGPPPCCRVSTSGTSLGEGRNRRCVVSFPHRYRRAASAADGADVFDGIHRHPCGHDGSLAASPGDRCHRPLRQAHYRYPVAERGE
jgi:hypothetical protein